MTILSLSFSVLLAGNGLAYDPASAHETWEVLDAKVFMKC